MTARYSDAWGIVHQEADDTPCEAYWVAAMAELCTAGVWGRTTVGPVTCFECLSRQARV